MTTVHILLGDQVADAPGALTGLIFFGVSCLVIGYLMLRSRYFPRTLGVLQAIAGICSLINSFALLLSPPFADKVFPAIVLQSFIAELSTCVWLLVRGVNVPMWQSKGMSTPFDEAPTAGLLVTWQHPREGMRNAPESPTPRVDALNSSH
jgi:hypothetical protein